MPPLPSPICVECRVAPATKKGRCDVCRRAYHRRVWLSRKGTPPEFECPICEKPTRHPGQCATCARKRGGPRTTKRLQAEGRISKPESWRNKPEKSAPIALPKPGGRKIVLVKARPVEPIADDEERAAAVNEMLARRRRLTNKGQV